MNEELKIEVRKMALQNAFEHGGKTQEKIILGENSWNKTRTQEQSKRDYKRYFRNYFRGK